MSPPDEKTKSSGQVEADDRTSDDGGEPEKRKLELHVEIKDAGPCKKHVRVRIPRSEVDRFYEETVKTLAERTAIPGFRPGHVPQKLVEKRFRTELANDVKQRVLVESMEQLSDKCRTSP